MDFSCNYFLTFNNNFTNTVYFKTPFLIGISLAWHFPGIKGAVKLKIFLAYGPSEKNFHGLF